MNNPTTRFSDRVDNYIKYRPSYPAQVLEHLKTECGLTSDSLIADIGSGTGILTQMFLDNQNEVYAVEPNAEMRKAAESVFNDIPHFHSIAATAEETLLAAKFFDFIIAGQAFHWFDRGLAKQEFQRILKPHGWVVLIWNERKIDSTPFLAEYEEMLLELATDYQEINHTNISTAEFAEFFKPHPVQNHSIPNSQTFDYPALKGRLLSSSYCPQKEAPGYEQIMKRLKNIFEKNEQNGSVVFEYNTSLFYGQLN